MIESCLIKLYIIVFERIGEMEWTLPTLKKMRNKNRIGTGLKMMKGFRAIEMKAGDMFQEFRRTRRIRNFVLE